MFALAENLSYGMLMYDLRIGGRYHTEGVRLTIALPPMRS